MEKSSFIFRGGSGGRFTLKKESEEMKKGFLKVIL